MTITQRAFKKLGRTAQFAPDGGRLLLADGYIHALELPSLRTIYRVRPLPGMSYFVMHPDGQQMLVPYGRGRYGILRVQDGAVVTTFGDNEYVGDQKCCLSTCGGYVVRVRAYRDICVLEVATGRTVWQRTGRYQHAAPLGATGEWLILNDNVAEIWQWPFGERSVREFNVGQFSFHAQVQGTLAALDFYRGVQVVDLVTGQVLFKAPGETLSKPYLREDGSLVVASRDELCLYSKEGVLMSKLLAAQMEHYGHAFHPQHDDAALMFDRGLLFVRGLASSMATLEAIAPRWPTITQTRQDGIRSCTYYPEPPAALRSVEAETTDELEAALTPFKRTAWRPVVQQEDGAVEASKFGGVPWLGKGEDWPRCGQCGEPMNLYLQLNAAQLPQGCPRLFDGVLQLFLCSTETFSGGACESFEEFSSAQLVRVVQPDGPSSVSRLPDEELFGEHRIVGWNAEDDYPGNQELEQLGIGLDDEQQELNLEGHWRFPSGDKLLGWPAWEQSIDRMRCPDCNETMREIFQIESYDTLPFMMGDGGRGWIRQCPAHLHRVCFSWQCG